MEGIFKKVLNFPSPFPPPARMDEKVLTLYFIRCWPMSSRIWKIPRHFRSHFRSTVASSVRNEASRFLRATFDTISIFCRLVSVIVASPTVKLITIVQRTVSIGYTRINSQSDARSRSNLVECIDYNVVVETK